VVYVCVFDEGEDPEILNNKLEDAVRRIIYMKGNDIIALAKDFPLRYATQL